MEDWIDKYSNVLWENFAAYNTTIGEHDLTGLVGMSYEDFKHPNYYLKSGLAVPLIKLVRERAGDNDHSAIELSDQNPGY